VEWAEILTESVRGFLTDLKVGIQKACLVRTNKSELSKWESWKAQLGSRKTCKINLRFPDYS
jgi:hypothetical protein